MSIRYLKAQGFVLLCGGLVGPIFLAVYFALGNDPFLEWMFWWGLLVTAADVLIALAIANHGAKGTIDIRSNPAVRELPVAHRLAQLEDLRAAGTITDAEYTTKRQQIIAELGLTPFGRHRVRRLLPSE